MAAGEALKRSVAPAAVQLAAQLPACAQRASSGCSLDALLDPREPVSTVEFAGPVEMAPLAGKGRGLKATRDVKAGECLLINRALVCASVDEAQEGTFLTFTGNTYHSSSHSKAAQQLLRSGASDVTLRRRLAMLHGSSCGGHPQPLEPVGNLLQHVDFCCVPPFLPAKPAFAAGPHAARGLDAAEAERILDLNCHGSELMRPMGEGEAQGSHPDLKNSSTSLYPAVALLNHASRPNTRLIPAGSEAIDMVALFAARDVAEGEELTTSYSTDKEALHRKWGIRDP